MRSQGGQGKEASGGLEHILEFVTNSPISGSSLAPPGHESVCGPHIYTLALVGGSYSHFSVLEG